MAQTGYTPISIYYSTTASTAPTAGNLVNGELAINITDGKLYYKDNAGVVQVIAGKGGAGVAGGSNTQVQYNSSGSLAGSANMTFNGTALTLANDASISGLTVGKGGGAVSSNTAVGLSALNGNSTGANNTAVGYQSLLNNTANNNVAYGYASLKTNTSGTQNTGIGQSALFSNTTASSNTAVGFTAMYNNTTGASNTAIGQDALNANTTASNNTAVGYQAGYSTTTGQVIAIGAQAGYALTTGSNNVVLGTTALYTATTANANTAIGHASLQACTGSSNLGIGYLAGQSLTTGSFNTFVGSGAYASYGSGFAVTTGSRNTILGNYSGNQGGLDIRTASNYIVLSDGDGNPRGIFDGSGNAYVGCVAQPSNTVNGFYVGANGAGVLQSAPSANANMVFYKVASASQTAYVLFQTGASNVGSITQNGNTAVLYNITSDRRLKENIVDAPSALAKINSVKVRSFDFKLDGSHVDFGTIAQELYEVAPECVSKGDDGEEIEHTWGVDTSVLVPAMIKAIQELKAEVDSLKTQLGK